MSCAIRCIALRLTAYLLYHFVVRLSRGFSNFFQVFSLSRLSPTLRCRSLAAPIVYHILPHLSTPFCKFFRDFSVFPAGKVTALGLWVLYWLLQCRIPHRMCRFYWLLAGAVGKRQGISIPYPSPTPLLTPGGSAAAGHDCCRGLMPILDSGIRCYCYSPVPNFVQLSVFGLVSFAFQSGCPACIARFSLLGG